MIQQRIQLARVVEQQLSSNESFVCNCKLIDSARSCSLLICKILLRLQHFVIELLDLAVKILDLVGGLFQLAMAAT